jgi:hypothetical protein
MYNAYDWFTILYYVMLGIALGWLALSGIPKFLAFAWKGTKQILQVVFGILGAGCLIGAGCWVVVTYLV